MRRLVTWLDGFRLRHGPFSVRASAEPLGWVLGADDGSTAVVRTPPWVRAHPGDDPAALAELRPVFGALLVRRAGYAVARFEGSERVEAKVGRRHIHGRTAAGGWSQQRYARRRSNQADEIAAAAATAADRIIVGRAELTFLVTGGDRPLLADVLRAADTRLAGLAIGAHLGMGTPDSSVLAGIPDRVLAVQVDLLGSATP